MRRFFGMIGRCLEDRGGNIALMAAVALPVVLFGAGVAIDTTNIVLQKNRLQAAVDSGALAAASGLANKHMTVDEARETAHDYVVMAMRNTSSSAIEVGTPAAAEALVKQAAADKLLVDNTSVTIEPKTLQTGAKGYDISVKSNLPIDLNAMTRLVSSNGISLSATGKSEGVSDTKNALSMVLVLDRSGSMAWKTDTKDTSTNGCYIYEEAYWPYAKWSTPCYVSKIATLKKAVNSLLTQLKTADPTSIYVRTSAISYNDAQDAAGVLAWGTAGTGTYVNTLLAEGGTDSSDAFTSAYRDLSGNTETKAHAQKTGATPTKYIVFMTDGENNFYQNRTGDSQATRSDAATKFYCDKARDDGIKVFTVAFKAPKRGQDLLQGCATDPTYYFQAEKSEDLVAAFKTIGDKASNLMVRLTQ
ncbi:Flp pilus assembly protein TadG [Rhizobium sp. PP-WC-2G-219]|nr:Flp pilus assembly protein TadG [Rhizobium sp. PP-CC-3A-592]PYE41732.1 Flp pilus assembly protein TadG [Rhizobium sp. PP-F2F-G20b]TCL91832.1 Flp pilus assembly protein TadG [Rhizobium sp. PP-WC-2G-219]